MDEDFILVVQEVTYHPSSYVKKLTERFEVPSVLRVTRREELRKFRAPPLFNDKYLVLFEDLKILQENLSLIRYDYMFPVLVVESKSQLDDAMLYFHSISTGYKLFRNTFTKEDAIRFVHDSAKQEVSESFCKAVIRQVGCSPMRILTALNVCDQMGYSVSVVERYIDKYVYVDKRRVIDVLLGVSKSKAAARAAFLYLQTNRHWYRYVRDDLVDELDVVFRVYQDKLSGALRHENLFDYLEENHLTRANVLYATSLFERVSVSSVLALREFIKTASLLEVAMQMS